MVTLVFDDTTCTFVTTVSDVTKNPEPRPDEVSTTTTAGEARLTRSSSDAEAGAGVEGSASSVALRAGCAGVAPASAGDAALGSPDLASVSGRATGRADAVTVRFAVSADGPGLINHQPPPAPTTANATIMRATAAPVLSVAAGVASSTGEVAADWRLEPHRQVATLGGTRRPHSAHTQLVADGSRSLTIRFSAVDGVRRLTHVYRFASAGKESADGARKPASPKLVGVERAKAGLQPSVRSAGGP
jgi:hypothetical protein